MKTKMIFLGSNRWSYRTESGVDGGSKGEQQSER